MEWLAAIAREYGPFVALVVWILWFFQKLLKDIKTENQERELRYISIIDRLSDSFQDLKSDVDLIKKKLWDGAD